MMTVLLFTTCDSVIRMQQGAAESATEYHESFITGGLNELDDIEWISVDEDEDFEDFDEDDYYYE